MSRIQWTKASQFNWAFDNMGGAPLMEAAAGRESGAATQVADDGMVYVRPPMVGAGRICYVRGVWLGDTVFPWQGFWAEPESGELVNFFTGGSYDNVGDHTVITLGSPLAPHTGVQVFYLYLTQEFGQKYEPLNVYPCIRRASRRHDDFTYDFAVDRLLDLMATLHFAGRERQRDYGSMIKFLWDAFYIRQASSSSPLFLDTFARSQWDRGAYVLYRNSTQGISGFRKFAIDLYGPADGSTEGPADRRALEVELLTAADGVDSTYSAWWGYGFNWSRQTEPFSGINTVSLKVQSPLAVSRVTHLAKSGNGGTAVLRLQDNGQGSELLTYVLTITQGGEVGQARFSLQAWDSQRRLQVDYPDVATSGVEAPIRLDEGVCLWWEPGPGSDFIAGDVWTFRTGDLEYHPRRLSLTLNDAPAQTADPWDPAHTFVHALPDRFAELTPLALDFSQFWRLDNIIDDRDRRMSQWGAWYATVGEGWGSITMNDREITEIIDGEIFYTQMHVRWDLPENTTAFGVWVGIDTARVNSLGHNEINLALQPLLSANNKVSLRIKIKDAQGSYFYQDVTVNNQAWNRIRLPLANFILESGSGPLCHPLQAVDIGMVGSPPPNDGAFLITDIKFGEHATFATASHLRVLEFKYAEGPLALAAENTWRLDDISLNLEAADTYPYLPRLAVSLGPYGQNPWRGPTLVHYAHPLAPWLMDRHDLAITSLHFHAEAQSEYVQRYGGQRGALMPVHTRNDLENITLCGEENFGRFCWWPRYRDYGSISASWHFNEALLDGSGGGNDFSWNGGGSADFTTGLSQPGNTAVSLDGSHYLFAAHHADLDTGADDFSWELVFRTNSEAAATLIDKFSGNAGVQVNITTGGRVQARVGDGALVRTVTGAANLADGLDHYVVLSYRSGTPDGMVLYVDGYSVGSASSTGMGSLSNTVGLTAGVFFLGALDLIRLHKGRALENPEITGRWQIIRGQLNGSAYPEAGSGLGQYWAFMRLAEYFFATGDGTAGELLDDWLGWLDAYGAADGPGWKFPTFFSEYGFGYGSYDPGSTAALAIGCLYIFMRTGDSRAGVWAERILTDLRQHRQSGDFGGYLYKSDYHYGWLNALVAHAFGLAAGGRLGAAYPFPVSEADREHFLGLVNRFFQLSGDGKPNVLNRDGIPFTIAEDADVWDYAPHYVALRQLGSLEAVVLMLQVAVDYGVVNADWQWFDRLLGFMLSDNLVVLSSSQLRRVTLAYDLTAVKNVVRVMYADYDQDNSSYAEARQNDLIGELGELPLELDLRYGGTVISEDPTMARILAHRLLERRSQPREIVRAETWLEGARIELGDTVALSSDFHDLDQAEYQCFGKTVSLDTGRVQLDLLRQVSYRSCWAVDAGGTVYDAFAIDGGDPEGPDRPYRAHVY